MWNMLLIQAIGVIGYGTLTLSFFKKEKKQILFIQIISYLFFTIHYYLLNGVTGAICNLLGLLALATIYIFEKFEMKKKIKTIVSMFFVILILIINIITFQNIYSIFPMIASVISIISFLMDSEDYIRGVGVISTICWLIYAIVYKSYISIAFEVVTLTGTLIAFIKNTSNPKVKMRE